MCCRVALAICFISAVFAFGQEKPELAKLSVYPDFLSADGIWRADNLNEKTELVFDAVTLSLPKMSSGPNAFEISEIQD